MNLRCFWKLLPRVEKFKPWAKNPFYIIRGGGLPEVIERSISFSALKFMTHHPPQLTLVLPILFIGSRGFSYHSFSTIIFIDKIWWKESPHIIVQLSILLHYRLPVCQDPTPLSPDPLSLSALTVSYFNFVDNTSWLFHLGPSNPLLCF